MTQRYRMTGRMDVVCLVLILLGLASSTLALLAVGPNSGQVLAENTLSIVGSIQWEQVWEGHYSSWTIGDSAYLITAIVTSGGSPVGGASVVADVTGPNDEGYWLRDGTQVLYYTVQGKGMDESGWKSGPIYGGVINDGIYANFLELDAPLAEGSLGFFANHAGTWRIRLTASKEGYNSASTELTLNIEEKTGNFGHNFRFIDLDTSTPDEDWVISTSPGQTFNARLVYDETNPCAACCVFYIRGWGCPYLEWGDYYDIDSGCTGYRSNVERTWTYTVPSTPGIYTMTLADNPAYWWPFYGENVGFVGKLVVEGSNTPPNAPSNPSPADHALGVSINTDFSWTGGDPNAGDTVTYDVYFGTSSSPPLVSDNQAGTTYDPGPLAYNTKYYWKVVAKDNRGGSTIGPLWDFTTGSVPNNPPDMPSDPSPADHASGVDINADLSWTGGDPDAGDTVTYDVYFGTSSSPQLFYRGLTGTSHSPGTLDYNTKYYWKVVAKDNRGGSTIGPLWDFTTGLLPNNPPIAPANPWPETHATDVDINADLSWTGGDPDAGDTVTYDVYFGTSSSPQLFYRDLTGTSHSPGTLDYNTKYYWKVVAKDNRGGSTIGPLWDFTTGSVPNNPPDMPSDPSPADHASGVDINADLSWTGGDPDPGNTVTYDVYLGTSSNLELVSVDQPGKSFDLKPLTPNTKYYWKVVATDELGASTIGPVWDFTTRKPPNDRPSTPSNRLPANYATGLSPTLALKSSDFSDPDPTDSHYASQWQITTGSDDYADPVFDSGADIVNLTQITVRSGILDYDTTYYWRVRHQDNRGAWSEWSEETQFKTEQPVPNGWLRFVMPGGIVLAGIVLLGATWRNRTLRMKRNMRQWEEEGYDLSDWR